jgi:hypothetical protein
MILTNIELLKVLTKRPNKKLIEFGRNQRKRARMHLYGVDMAEHLTMIEGFEKPWMQQIRAKYVQSNKDMLSRVTKPILKIFTARGGSTYFNLKGKEEQIARMLDGKIQSNVSCKKWLETVWKGHMLDDPMGLIYMEIDSRGNVYPTYKSIDDIYEYRFEQGQLEYIVFEMNKDQKEALKLENEAQVFRVVDDTFDRIIILKDQDTIVEAPGQTYFNYFGIVPGIANSPFPNPDGTGYISPLYWIMDLADQFLLKISIRLTHEFRHGFPKYYEFADDCLDCKGTGKIKAKECSACKGTGKKIMLHVSDVKLLEYPTKDVPGLKGPPGGYIEPSKTFWEICTDGLMELEERINQTLWGSKTNSKLKPGMGLSAAPNGTVTATEVMDNRNPEVECLNTFSDAAEVRHKFIMDCVVAVRMRKSNYIADGGCSINYGRRFLIEEPDALLKRYSEARKEGLSPSILYGMYEQYLEAKYQSDGVSLSLHKKLMKIEPFMHMTVAELKNSGATPQQMQAKMHYGEWLANMNGNTLILASVSALQQSFADFLADKPLPVEEKPAGVPK